MTKNQIYEMDLLLSKNKGLLSAEEENEYISLLNYAKSNLIEENIVNEEDTVDELINEDITEELVNEEINEVLDDDSVEDEIEEPENIIETNTSEMFFRLLKLYKKLQILIYDSSENVNSFYLNGIQMWLTPSDRANYLLTIEAAKENNINSVPFKGIILPVDLILQALKAINLYAMQCINVTESHIENIMNLESEDEISNYDFTLGYPEKLNF